MTPPRTTTPFRLALTVAIAFAVAPLWAARHLPAVDAPQHLFLIHVLGALEDPASHYHAVYERGAGLTYVTFYWGVKWLGALVGVEDALRLWLSLVIAAIPLSVLLLLRAFGKDPWLALLACPLAYTDNFYWGLFSFVSSVPLTLAVCALFVRVLESDGGWKNELGLAACLVALQLTHAAAIVFPAFALPLLLLTTRTDWRRRLCAVIAVLPGVLLFLAWLASGVHRDRTVGVEGEPWKAVAPLFDPRSYVFQPLRVRAGQWFDLLSNGFWSWADRPPVIGLTVVVGVLVLVGVVAAVRDGKRRMPDLRPAMLLGLALLAFFALPTDVHGYMYMIHPRYAQLSALFVIPVLALPTIVPRRVVAPVFVALAAWSGITLVVQFHRFEREAAQFEPIAAQIAPGARILHLVVDKGSAVATHAVYLHYAALAALRVDGVPSFSLAQDPSFPVRYREGARPPAPPWEWRPQQSTWHEHGRHYDFFLQRGDLSIRRLFGAGASELELVARNGKWVLWRRRGASAQE